MHVLRSLRYGQCHAPLWSEVAPCSHPTAQQSGLGVRGFIIGGFRIGLGSLYYCWDSRLWVVNRGWESSMLSGYY